MKKLSQQKNESLEQFLARGGQIKNCPTRKCSGWRLNKVSNRNIRSKSEITN